MERGNYEGKGWPIVKYRDTVWWTVQKRLNQSRCRFGFGLSLMGPRKHVLCVVHTGTTWRIPLNCPRTNAWCMFDTPHTGTYTRIQKLPDILIQFAKLYLVITAFHQVLLNWDWMFNVDVLLNFFCWQQLKFLLKAIIVFIVNTTPTAMQQDCNESRHRTNKNLLTMLADNMADENPSSARLSANFCQSIAEHVPLLSAN